MDKLFNLILSLSLSSLPLLAAILILRLIFSRRAGAVRLWLWAPALFALICPIRPVSGASLMPAESFSLSALRVSVEPEALRAPGLSAGELGAAAFDMLPWVWLAGLIILLTAAGLSFIRLRRATAASLRLRDNIFICDNIDSAFILGLLPPKIFIPSDTGEGELPYIIAHERSHIKNGDHIFKALGYLALCLHWFNPMVWLCYGLFCRDIELCCDERVIRPMGSGEKRAYSRALLSASLSGGRADFPLAFAELGVKKRVKAVLHYKKPGFIISLAAALACCAAALLFMTVPEAQGEGRAAAPAQPAEEHVPLPGEGAPTVYEQGESYIRVNYLGHGEARYDILSAELREDFEGMESCLLISFSVENISVNPSELHSAALANAFKLSDGSDWARQGRFFLEPDWLDIAEAPPSRENKQYFAYDFPAIGESAEFTLGYEMSEEALELLRSGGLYLDYIHDYRVKIPVEAAAE